MVVCSPFPLVWSPGGPAFGVSVGPLHLSQSRSSAAPWIHPHESFSKEHVAKEKSGKQEN